MRKLIFIVISSYSMLYIFYFIYSITSVTYSRREFSKRDLSDGPLVLKEGVIVGRKGSGVGVVKKVEFSNNKQKKINKSKLKIQTKLKEPLPTLDEDFIKKFVEEAKRMSATRHLLYITVVNGAFERLTINWLCNTMIFTGLHDMSLFVSTSKSLCDSLHHEYGHNLTCIFMNLPGYDEDLSWGDQKYINFLTIRAQLMRILTENSVRFVLIETDSTWFRNPLEVFLNATVVDDADIVVPSKGYTHKGDNLAFSPMLVEPTNTSVVLFNEIIRRLLGDSSLYDQDVLNELCSVQYHGVVCRNFEYSDIADGKWFRLDDDEKSNMKPAIVNNNFYVGLKHKETRQAINGLWFLNKSGHCSISKVEHALRRFVGVES